MKKILCIALTFLFCFSYVLTVSAEEVKWLAKPQYEEIYGGDEDGDMILAKMNDKYGFIDRNGKIIIDFVYDYASGFSEGMAFVEKEKVYSYIDKSGKTIFNVNLKDYLKNSQFLDRIEIDEDCYALHGTSFSGDYAIVEIESTGDSFIIDKAGKYVSMPDGLSFRLNLYNDTANIYNNIAIISKVTDGVGYLDISDGETKCDGYLNIKTGKTVFSNYQGFKGDYRVLRIDQVKDFKDGYGILNHGDGTISVVNESLDFINEKINVGTASPSISNGMIYLEEFTEDYMPLYGSYIDMKGETIIPKNYVSLGEYKDGLISAVIEENGVKKAGYIDINGKWVIKPVKASSYTPFFRGLAAFSETYNDDTYNENYGVIDKTGKYVIQPQFEDFLYDSYNAYAKVNGLWGILSLDGLTSANVPSDTPDTWAVVEVRKAINNNLVPSALQNNYSENITRKEFCDLAISLIEAKTGKNIDEVISSKGLSIAENVFVDTIDKNVLAAYTLSVVQGKDKDIFAPNAHITRQEAAIMLTNTAKALGADVNSKEAEFADIASISTWAKAAVNYVSSNMIMNGTNKGFEARANFTRQQAYAAIFRLFEAIK